MGVIDHVRFHATNDPVAAARAFRRSWWVMRMTDGRLFYEWETDWLQVPRMGRQALRLYCPNGQYIELGGTVDATDRLFQLKSATRAISMGRAIAVGREIVSHVVGIITGTDGSCQLCAWEPAWPLAVIYKPFRDWLTAEALRGDGLRSLRASTGLSIEQLDDLVRAKAVPTQRLVDRTMRNLAPPRDLVAIRERIRRGILVGPLTDNAYAVAYRNIGPLCAVHLGIAEA